MMRAVECFKHTPDQWYGNYSIEKDQRYTGGFVLVRFSELGDKYFRVSIWGNDDCGMELDFSSKKKAQDEYLELMLLPSISKRTLTSRGYMPA